MDEINPYAPPGSALPAEASKPKDARRPRGYRGYKWLSLAYGALLGAVCVGLIQQPGRGLNVPTAMAILVMLMPLLSYLVVAAGWRRLFYVWMVLHLLSACALVGYDLERRDPANALKDAITLVLWCSSLLSWLASLYFHWRLGRPPYKN